MIQVKKDLEEIEAGIFLNHYTYYQELRSNAIKSKTSQKVFFFLAGRLSQGLNPVFGEKRIVLIPIFSTFPLNRLVKLVPLNGPG